MASRERIIVSNNPQIKDSFPGVEFIEGNVSAVLIQVRDYVHRGYRLINHPLAASVVSEGNPYRSLILIPGTGLDYRSLEAIEAALSRSREGKRHAENGWQDLDREILKEAWQASEEL